MRGADIMERSRALLADERAMRTAPRVASDLFSTSYGNYIPRSCDFLTTLTISQASPAMRRCATIREGQICAFVLFLRWLPAFFAVVGWSGPPRPTSGPYLSAAQSGTVSGKIPPSGRLPYFFDVQKSQEPVTLEFLMTTTPKSRGNSAWERPPRSTIAPKT